MICLYIDIYIKKRDLRKARLFRNAFVSFYRHDMCHKRPSRT